MNTISCDWWNYPLMTVHEEPFTNNYYCLQLLKLRTSKEFPYEACDTPISFQNVKVSRIPGRFPFRILTYINNTNIPVEQDIFFMDIPIPDLQQFTI